MCDVGISHKEDKCHLSAYNNDIRAVIRGDIESRYAS